MFIDLAWIRRQDWDRANLCKGNIFRLAYCLRKPEFGFFFSAGERPTPYPMPCHPKVPHASARLSRRQPDDRKTVQQISIFAKKTDAHGLHDRGPFASRGLPVRHLQPGLVGFFSSNLPCLKASVLGLFGSGGPDKEGPTKRREARGAI